MNQARLNQGMLGVLLLMVSVANAQEYPAADFQPKVLYRDESVAVSAAASSSADSAEKAPCITQEQTAAAGKQEAAAVVDSQYPASSFQPKVIFSQAN